MMICGCPTGLAIPCPKAGLEARSRPASKATTIRRPGAWFIAILLDGRFRSFFPTQDDERLFHRAASASRPRRPHGPASCPAVADGHQEDHTLPGRVRGEELGDLVVVECKPCGTDAEGVREEVDLATEDARLQLDGPVPPISEALQDRTQRREIVDVHRGIARQGLLEGQVPGLIAELAFPQLLEHLSVPMMHIRP